MASDLNDDILKTQMFDPLKAAPPGDSAPQLVTLEGTRIGSAHPLVKDRTEVGRLETNDLVLPSNPVSKRHAAFIRESGLFFVEDLGSTNGVIVNGNRLAVDSRRRLYHGDNIRISDHLFLFRQESAFVDSTGLCSIQLDEDKINSEVTEFLAEWKQLQEGGL